MASISKLASGKWRARYRDAAGKQHASHHARKADAQRWLDEVTASVVTGAYVAPRAGNITFREYAEDWRASQPYRASTADVVRVALVNRVYPLIGDVRLAAFTPDTVQRMVKTLGETYAPSTVEVTYSYVSTVFKAAVASRRISTTPCVGIKLPEVVKAKVVPMSVEQVFAIADEMPDRWAAMVMLAAGTGMRQGEVFGLTTDRVKFLERRLVVDRQLLGVQEGQPVFGPTKTPTSNRVVPLPQVVADSLAAHLEQHPAGEHGLIFTTAKGEALRKSSVWSTWKRCHGCGRRGRRGLPLAAAPLRLAPHPARRVGRHGAGAAGPQVGAGNLGHVLPPLARR